MFKKILFACLSIVYITLPCIHASAPEEKNYGVTVHIQQEPEAYFLEQFDKISVILKADSIEDIGTCIETGMPVWFAQDYKDAEAMQELLKKEGYAAEILEVILYDAPGANVISLKTQYAMALLLQELLGSAA